ncbi:hypothetical protein JB92DRAFT_3034110 [Gautieria morchelliformis]|nr:hypothetical protein JB92DRAFT_3034110 [Gautieria morchelliformis]
MERGLEVSFGQLRLPPALLLPGRRTSRSRFHASPAASCALQTIRDSPSLFKVTTPIHVDHFEFLLSSHPLVVNLPRSHLSDRDIYEPGLDCLREQRGFEIAACGRYSPSHAFGCDLLPGIYSTPVGVVSNTPLGQISPYQRPQHGTSRAPTLGPRAMALARRIGHVYRCWPVHPDHVGTSSESHVRRLALPSVQYE